MISESQSRLICGVYSNQRAQLLFWHFPSLTKDRVVSVGLNCIKINNVMALVKSSGFLYFSCQNKELLRGQLVRVSISNTAQQEILMSSI